MLEQQTYFKIRIHSENPACCIQMTIVFSVDSLGNIPFSEEGDEAGLHPCKLSVIL